MSTITSTLPTALNRLICPPTPKRTIARLDSTLPPARLMFDATGCAPPAGKAITYVLPLLRLIAVIFTATACAPVGTGVPVIWTVMVSCPVPSVPFPAASHWLDAIPGATFLVSHVRKGLTAVYAPPATNVYWSAGGATLDVPPGVTTLISTVPAATVGV